LIKGLIALLALFIVLGFLTLQEIRRIFPFELVLVVGSALGIAQVMIESGVAELAAAIPTQLFAPWGVYGGFVGAYILTWLLTEVVTNNAAAALAFPVAYSVAVGYGADPMPFVMAVAYGASASFLTPYGYQTNLMVYSVGGYRFADYLRMGFPVALLYSLTVIVLVPMVFPF